MILVGIPFVLITLTLSVKNRGVGGGGVNEENLLRVTKVICQQSLHALFNEKQIELFHKGGGQLGFRYGFSRGIKEIASM